MVCNNPIFLEYSDRAAYGVHCLLSLEHWDREFDSHSRHRSMRLCVCVFGLSDIPFKYSQQMRTNEVQKPAKWKAMACTDLQRHIGGYIPHLLQLPYIHNSYYYFS